MSNLLYKFDEEKTKMLFQAAKLGDADVVPQLINQGANVNEKDILGSVSLDEYQSTPLLYASKYGHADLAKVLIAKGANVYTRDICGHTPLSKASELGHADVVKVLLDNRARVNAEDQDTYKMTPLHHASKNGHTDVVRLLIARGANIDAELREYGEPTSKWLGCTPLHEASREGHSEVVKVLLCNGANLSIKDRNGYTPLLDACTNGHADVVGVLLDYEADPNDKDSMRLACENGHIDVVNLLLDSGADVNATDKFEWAPLHTACIHGHLKLVSSLLNNGATVDAKSSSSWTPAGSDENTNANPLHRSVDNGLTPLHCACYSGHTDVVKLLLVNGADVNAKNMYGCTPLHCAINFGHVDIVELLLVKGSNVQVKNTTGHTPIDYAKSHGHESIVKLLNANEPSQQEHCSNSDDFLCIEKENVTMNVESNKGHASPSAAEDSYVRSINHQHTIKWAEISLEERTIQVTKGSFYTDDALISLSSNHTKPDIASQSKEPSYCTFSTGDVKSELQKKMPNGSEQEELNRKNFTGEFDEIRAHLNSIVERTDAIEPIELPPGYIQSIRTNKRLGGGYFGEVCLGEDDVIKKKFAIKLINPLVIDDAFAGRLGPIKSLGSIQNSFRNEIRVLSWLNHPNIASLYGYCMQDNNLQNKCLVYELAANGSLDKFWESDLGRTRLSDEIVRSRIALEVATALRYMHEGLDGGAACFHRDIKSGNVCLAADLSSRIIDCGLSKYVTERDGSVSSAGPSGTPGYICPQYTNGAISFCSACDVFSFGVLLCELITGKTSSRKSPHFSNYKIQEGILEDDADECVDWGSGFRLKRLSEMALECMRVNACSRPSIGSLVEELGDIVHGRLQAREKKNHSNLKCRSCGFVSCASTIMHCFGTQQHFHCNDCFEIHLQKNINRFSYILTCPKEGCNSRPFLDTEVAHRVSPNVWMLYLVQRGSNIVDVLQNSLASIEKRLAGTIKSESKKMKDLQVQLCAGNGLPCPRLFLLVSTDHQKKFFQSPREWAKNKKSRKLYIYFVCSHSQQQVSDDARITVQYTPDWLKKIAPALNASLTLIKMALDHYSGGILPLDLVKIKELDEWSKELMDSADREVMQNATLFENDQYVRELLGKSLSFVAEKSNTNKNWMNEMIPVYDHEKKVSTFVLRKYAALPRYGGKAVEL